MSEPSPELHRQFASDNCAGICPEAWQALAQANTGHTPSYGDDSWTTQVADRLRELFEIDCEVFFCFNGTAANSMAVAHLCRSFQSVLCHELAHLEADECGAPEFFSHGAKLLLVEGDHCKIDPAKLEAEATRRDDLHFPKPRVLSLTQATERGTVYTVAELDALWEVARRHHLRIHMDGARFANAVAHLKVAPKEITWKVGVDVLCFGGTKNGLPVGEAVVFFDRELAREFDFRCKQAGQLASKMRFISAPWLGMLDNDTWLHHAGTANSRARQLEAALQAIHGVRVLFPVEANSVFVMLPAAVNEKLHAAGWRYHTMGADGCSRLMCAWDTTEADVQAFATDVRSAMQS